jgi:uncharacterized membrane protein YqaE (UPF0057 family)
MRKGIILFFAAFVVSSYSFTPSYAALLPSADNTSLPADEPDPAKIRAAVNVFMSLPKKEKKSRIREARKAVKDFKKERRKGNDPSTETLLLVIIALFIPPLAVYLHQGETNNKFWITTLLFVIGIIGAFFFSWLLFLASVIYALIIILGNG